MSDEAREAFIDFGLSSDWNLMELAGAAIKYKNNTHGVANAQTILNAFGPYDGYGWERALSRLFGVLDADDPQ